MKRVLIFIVFVASFCCGTWAQTYDTICKGKNYYYSRWYDTCACYLDGQRMYPIFAGTVEDTGSITAIPSYTSSPIKIKGGVVMVPITVEDYAEICWYDPHPLSMTYLPEYLMVYQYDSEKDSMILLHSVRWDTVHTIKVVRFPLVADTAGEVDTVRYCYAYEVYFDSAVSVHDTFYLGGTHNSNVRGSFFGYDHMPVAYYSVRAYPTNGCLANWPNCYLLGRWRDPTDHPEDNLHNIRYYGGSIFGGILPIADMYDLDVAVEDSSMGSVEGGGRYADSSVHQILAVASPGYHFFRWDDEQTDNPRTIQIVQDTLFTAIFLPNDIRNVEVVSFDEEQGTVGGGGNYLEGQTAVISAIPSQTCAFSHWNDGDTTNPRYVTVSQDTSFTAYFRHLYLQDIEAAAAAFAFTLTPNPARDRFTVTLPGDVQSATMVLRDESGRERLRRHLATPATTISTKHLPRGLYFVTLTTPQGSSSQKLVIE